MELWGVDFTSAPSRRKPITLARGALDGQGRVVLRSLEALGSMPAFETLLGQTTPWFGGFDFPFGLPRIFVEAMDLGSTVEAIIVTLHRRCPSRMDFRALIDGWTNGRAPGQRLVHRVTDRTTHGVSSTSPLQSRYVPVAFMFYEGLHRLVQADVHLPGLRRGRREAIALEAYPGLLAHELIGRRSYKNCAEDSRREARAAMLHRLEQGEHRLGLRVVLEAAQRQRLLDDAAGDHLDALLCLVQAAWARARPDHGIPSHVDPVEGWIATS